MTRISLSKFHLIFIKHNFSIIQSTHGMILVFLSPSFLHKFSNIAGSFLLLLNRKSVVVVLLYKRRTLIVFFLLIIFGGESYRLSFAICSWFNLSPVFVSVYISVVIHCFNSWPSFCPEVLTLACVAGRGAVVYDYYPAGRSSFTEYQIFVQLLTHPSGHNISHTMFTQYIEIVLNYNISILWPC